MSVASGPKLVTNGLVLCLDATNPKSYSNNVQPYSQDLYGWFVGTNGASTISRDTTIAPSPAGGIPLKMAVTGSDPYMATYNAAQYNLAPAASGQTWVASVWVKASVATVGQIFLFGDSAAGGQVFTINDYAAGAITIPTDWTRVYFAFTFSNVAVQRVQCRLDGPDSGGAGINIWWDGLQVERASTPTNYNPNLNANGASWNDISGGGYKATLVSSPAYNSSGYLVFTGTQTVTVTNPLFASQTATNQTWTVSAWLNIDDTGNQSLINFGIGLYPSYGTNNSLLYLNSGANDYYTYGGDIGNLGWKYVTFRFNNATGARTIYSNAANISTSGPNNTSTPVALNAASTIASNLRGNLASLEIYNRMLTDDEVTQNFNALRGKYGV
jgi:hypothetical protein